MRKFYLLFFLVIIQLVAYGQNRIFDFTNVKSSANRKISSLVAAENNDSGSSAGGITNITTPTLPATGLSKGDLAVIGMNGDVDATGSTIRSFAVVALNTIAANEVIFITDRGWVNTYGSTPGHFVGAITTPRPTSTTGNEGILKWIPSVTIPAGTIIIFKIDLANRQVLGTKGNGTSLPSADFSILPDSWTNTTLSANPWPQATGDQLIIYQGSESSPSFIFAFNNIRVNGATTSNGWHINPNVVEPNNQLPLYSELPSDLGATYSIAFLTTTADSRYPNEKYNPNLTSASKTTWLADITNTGNWVNATTTIPPPSPIPLTPYDFSLGFGNTAMTQFQVGSLAAPVITANPPNRTICLGGSTTFPATVTNATSYQWQEDSGSGFVNITNAGVYSNATTATLTLTGATAGMSGYIYRFVATGTGGSATSNAATLTVINITATTSQTNVSCNGGTNGTATVTAAGGAGSYTYSWSPSGGTGATASGLAPGSYTVTITDANNCQTTKSFTITQPTAITATTSQTNVSCNGGTNGTATVTAAGGAGSYTYSWSPSGGTGASATGLAPGSYTVTITDANNCQTTKSFTITQPTAITATTSQTNVSCNGGTNGTATVTAAGGAGSYTYSWSPSGGTGASASGLAPGSYTVTITDANNCQTTKSFTITQPTAITATTSQTNVSCNGGTNGTATVTVAGGAGSYTYSWSPSGGTGATASGLAPGSYTVTITDANNCQTTKSFTITQPTAITATTSQTNVACNGGSTGSASVTVSGGTPGYTYSWSPSGGTGATASGLAAGTYTVTITDANSCQTTKSFTITQPTAITATTSQTNVSCNGGTNGTATVTAAGGAGSYTYSWSPSGGTGATANNLAAGTYTVTVTDSNFCTITKTITITQSAAVAAPTGMAVQSFNAGDTLSALVVNGQSIKWYASQSNATSHTNSLPLSTPIVNDTTYYATQTSGACESTASLAVRAYNPTLSVGNDIKATADLQIYPNPVLDILKVSGEERISKFVISSLDGRKITEKISREGERGINVSSLVQGTYLIQVFTKNQVKTFKFIKN